MGSNGGCDLHPQDIPFSAKFFVSIIFNHSITEFWISCESIVDSLEILFLAFVLQLVESHVTELFFLRITRLVGNMKGSQSSHKMPPNSSSIRTSRSHLLVLMSVSINLIHSLAMLYGKPHCGSLHLLRTLIRKVISAVIVGCATLPVLPLAWRVSRPLRCRCRLSLGRFADALLADAHHWLLRRLTQHSFHCSSLAHTLLDCARFPSSLASSRALGFVTVHHLSNDGMIGRGREGRREEGEPHCGV